MVYAGYDGESWGFFLEKERVIKSCFEITDNEHMALMDGQAEGKIITFHEDKKPTLEDPPPPTEEELARQEISELESYLTDTDWYAIRFADEGKEIPADIKQKRSETRKRISELREEYPEKEN